LTEGRTGGVGGEVKGDTSDAKYDGHESVFRPAKKRKSPCGNLYPKPNELNSVGTEAIIYRKCQGKGKKKLKKGTGREKKKGALSRDG